MDYIKLLPIICAALLPAAAPAADYLDRSAWTWSTSSDCAAEEDIVGLSGIHDGNTYTCWHSNYHADNSSPERRNPHWIMIDRGYDSTPVYGLSYLPRQNGNMATACTKYAIYFADKSLEDTPASSEQEIYYAIGDPAYSGSWNGDKEEKFVNFDSPVTSRYILFVNLDSNGSSSAACAEMNLLAKSGGGGDTPGPGAKYNAIRIVTPEGSAHRIAIDGENLTFSMAGGNIRMGNSGITVEYAMDEVKHFIPETYNFPEDEYYVGPKYDIYSVELSIDQEDMTLEVGKTGSIVATVLNAGENPVVSWVSSDPLVATVDSDGLVSAIAEGTSTVTATCGAASASCLVTVTAESGIDPEIPVFISQPEVPTLTIKRQGDYLILGGIISGAEAVIYNINGVKVASAPVAANGTASIAVGSLPSSAYLLSASGLTLKISF